MYHFLQPHDFILVRVPCLQSKGLFRALRPKYLSEKFREC